MSRKRTPNRYDELFVSYVAELHEALTAAKKNFDASNVRAPLQQAASIPLATDPRVIAVLRKYFFACDALTRDRTAGPAELPHVFIVEKLAGKYDELWEALAELPYLPIGTNREDRWVEETVMLDAGS